MVGCLDGGTVKELRSHVTIQPFSHLTYVNEFRVAGALHPNINSNGK